MFCDTEALTDSVITAGLGVDGVVSTVVGGIVGGVGGAIVPSIKES